MFTITITSAKDSEFQVRINRSSIIIKIIKVHRFDYKQLISTTYSTNSNIIQTLDTFKFTVTRIINNMNSIRNPWVNYKNDTGDTAQSVQIVNELNTQYNVLVSLKNTLSKCGSMIKTMIDNGLPDSYRTT